MRTEFIMHATRWHDASNNRRPSRFTRSSVSLWSVHKTITLGFNFIRLNVCERAQWHGKMGKHLSAMRLSAHASYSALHSLAHHRQFVFVWIVKVRKAIVCSQLSTHCCKIGIVASKSMQKCALVDRHRRRRRRQGGGKTPKKKWSEPSRICNVLNYSNYVQWLLTERVAPAVMVQKPTKRIRRRKKNTKTPTCIINDKAHRTPRTDFFATRRDQGRGGKKVHSQHTHWGRETEKRDRGCEVHVLLWIRPIYYYYYLSLFDSHRVMCIMSGWDGDAKRFVVCKTAALFSWSLSFFRNELLCVSSHWHFQLEVLHSILAYV